MRGFFAHISIFLSSLPNSCQYQQNRVQWRAFTVQAGGFTHMFPSKMKVYSVHLNPREDNPYEQAKFIPEGFNLYAFIFTGFWALYHRNWWMAALFFTLHFGSGFYGASVGLSAPSIVFLEFGFRVMIGLSANDLWRALLERKDWATSDVVVAYSELEATHRYYERHLKGLIDAHVPLAGTV